MQGVQSVYAGNKEKVEGVRHMVDNEGDTKEEADNEFFERMKKSLDRRLGYAEKFKEKIKVREEDEEKK